MYKVIFANLDQDFFACWYKGQDDTDICFSASELYATTRFTCSSVPSSRHRFNQCSLWKMVFCAPENLSRALFQYKDHLCRYSDSHCKSQAVVRISYSLDGIMEVSVMEIFQLIIRKFCAILLFLIPFFWLGFCSALWLLHTGFSVSVSTSSCNAMFCGYFIQVSLYQSAPQATMLCSVVASYKFLCISQHPKLQCYVLWLLHTGFSVSVSTSSCNAVVCWHCMTTKYAGRPKPARIAGRLTAA